jgi:lipoprotein-releasing system ATP-binding protein
LIKVENVTKSYGSLAVLKGIDMHVKKGEIVALVGASGAGKSTLLHVIGTIDNPDSGHILIAGKDISGLQGKKLAQFRNNHIGFIFQFHHLLPEFTAFENICIPGYIGGRPEKEVRKRAHELLEYLNMTDRKTHKPNALSGGEQQRIAVARALINQPDIVLADEPSGNLDSKNAKELHELFFQLRNQFDQTFVIATHNEELSLMADRSLRIKDGKIL